MIWELPTSHRLHSLGQTKGWFCEVDALPLHFFITNIIQVSPHWIQLWLSIFSYCVETFPFLSFYQFAAFRPLGLPGIRNISSQPGVIAMMPLKCILWSHHRACVHKYGEVDSVYCLQMQCYGLRWKYCRVKRLWQRQNNNALCFHVTSMLDVYHHWH